MSDLRDRVLPVVRTLMGRVSPQDYIYSMDQPPLRGRSAIWDMAVMFFGFALGAMTVWITLAAMGYTRLTSDDQAALRVVHRVDLRHEVASDEDLERRWKTLADGFRMMGTAVASAPEAGVYPYLADLSGHPPPEVDPGTGPSVVLLANALNLYPVETRGSIIHNLIELAASLNQPDMQSGLFVLASLPAELRVDLFQNGAASFIAIAQLQSEIDQEHGKAASLRETLTAERDQATRQVVELQTMVARGGASTRVCQRHLAACVACLPAPVNQPSTP